MKNIKDTRIFLYEWGRMCGTINDCQKCPMKYLCPEDEVPDDILVFSPFLFYDCDLEIMDAMGIVEEWSNNNPERTESSYC